MKKKILITLLCLGIVSILGCSNKETGTTDETEIPKTDIVGGSAIVTLDPSGKPISIKDNSYGNIEIETDKKETEITSETETVTEDILDANVNHCYIYTSNDEATGFNIIQVDYQDEDTLDVLVKNLKSQNIIPENVKINNFQIFDTKANLDLSEEYLPFITTQGTTGEYYSIACLVNSFLHTYDGLDTISVTVNGEGFSTGHAEYFGEFHMFE